MQKKNVATKLKGGRGKALVAGPLKKHPFLWSNIIYHFLDRFMKSAVCEPILETYINWRTNAGEDQISGNWTIQGIV